MIVGYKTQMPIQLKTDYNELIPLKYLTSIKTAISKNSIIFG